MRGRPARTRTPISTGWRSPPIDALKLGRAAGTDFLGISFSALDLTGHSYGPGSHEVQDILVNLDVQIGLLLDKLDRDLGAGNYVVGLSADHGVSPIPERLKAQGFDAGRIDTAGIGRAIDAVLAKELGPGTYRTRVLANDVYFNDGVYFKLTQNPAAMEAVLATIRKARRRLEGLSEGRTIRDRSADAAVVPQSLRGPQRRHQDARPRLLDHLRRAPPRTAPAIATTRACR